MKTAVARKVLILAVPVLTVWYAAFYISQPYSGLVAWYRNIGNTFYRAEFWTTDFFTETTRTKGNTWCIIGAILSLIWVPVAWKLPLQRQTNGFIHSKREYLLIALLGVTLSAISNLRTYYAFDEVFSALNFASLPQFQGLSYYALPNNHVLFNVLNRTLFFWSGDMVASGRIISMLCYTGVLMLSWSFMKRWMDNIWVRMLLLLSLALQFPVWGFSGQARGYEMILFFSVLSLYSAWGYWVERKTYFILPLVISTVLGMLTLLSFLYWLAGLNIVALWFMAERRKIDWVYMGYMASGMIILFLGYLPLLTFSGLSSMTDNQYMKATSSSVLEFLGKSFADRDYYRKLFTEWFCFDLLSKWPGYILVLLPFIGLVKKWRNNEEGYLPLLKIYVSMILAFPIVCMVLKNMPYSRNMLSHGYLVWLVVLLVLFTITRQLPKLYKFLIALLAVGTIFSTTENYKFMDYGLYYYNVADRYKSLDSAQFKVKPSSTVFLDNESFYWWYMLRKKFPDEHLEISHNTLNFHSQDYYIVNLLTNKPDTIAYDSVTKQAEFLVMRRKGIVNQ